MYHPLAFFGLGFDVAIKMNYLRSIEKDLDVDDSTWPFRRNNINVVCNNSKNWIFGMNCYGMDRESSKIGQAMKEFKPPFLKVNCGVKVPGEVWNRLSILDFRF